MEYARLDHCRYEGKWYQRCLRPSSAVKPKPRLRFYLNHEVEGVRVKSLLGNGPSTMMTSSQVAVTG